MKTNSLLTTICLLTALLGGCNPDVFIDPSVPSTDKMQVPADGTAATLSFGSGDWYLRGLFLEDREGRYEEIGGDIYDADGNRLYSDAPFSFNDAGLTKYVVRHPQLALTLERTGERELRLSDAENIGLETCYLALGVGNDYEYRKVTLVLDPSPRYQLDSIVYATWYLQQDSARTRQMTISPLNLADTPWLYQIRPFESFRQSFSFAGGDRWNPGVDPSQFQMFGTEMPVVPVPRLDKYNRPALLGDELPLSDETYEFPSPDEWLAVTNTVVVPPGKAMECVVECWFSYTGISYKIYAGCPQTGRRRVLEGFAELYTPQGYTLTASVRDVNIQQ